MEENTLKKIFDTHNGPRVHKWEHYLDIYEKYFSIFKGKPVHFLEIGVAHGGSLELWKKYFGPDSKFFGIDIIPDCKKFETSNTKIYIGSQGSEKFLTSISNQIPPLDFLLDDGSHNMSDQITSFNCLWPKIKNGGFYICEDVQTSYWFSHGGGYKRKNTFVEHVKGLIDNLHGWHSKQPAKFSVSRFTKEIKSIQIYNSIIFIEKGEIPKPTECIHGSNQVPEPVPEKKAFFILAYNKIKKILMGFK